MRRDSARLPGCPTACPPDELRRFLADPSPVVRAAAISALATHPAGASSMPSAMLVDSLEDGSHAVRTSAATALAGRSGVGHGLIEVLRTGSDRAQDAALVAVGSHAAEVHDDLLTWADGQIQRAEGLHRAHASLRLLQSTAEHRDFLDAVIAQRARRAEDRAIAALVAVGAPAAGGLMRRSLRSSDQDARAQAIEALDSLGDRRLGRALSACLEAASDTGGGDPLATLERLTQDGDHWIARLSRTVRQTTPPVEDAQHTMTGAEGTPTELDTMLLLRRVPLFARLDPEDLQRLAMVAMERQYPDGTALMREGDPGDELVVIVEGGVRVVQATPDGEERFIRRYQAGEHIGELAVLRDRPRVASVIAEGDVRGLVLGGDGLRAILRERPDAAMAMLATLAERISSQ